MVIYSFFFSSFLKNSSRITNLLSIHSQIEAISSGLNSHSMVLSFTTSSVVALIFLLAWAWFSCGFCVSNAPTRRIVVQSLFNQNCLHFAFFSNCSIVKQIVIKFDIIYIIWLSLSSISEDVNYGKGKKRHLRLFNYGE